MDRVFTVIYTPIEDGWIMATVPEVPGAMTQGRDMAEAKLNIQDALKEVLAAYRDLARQTAPAGAVWDTVSVDAPAL